MRTPRCTSACRNTLTPLGNVTASVSGPSQRAVASGPPTELRGKTRERGSRQQAASMARIFPTSSLSNRAPCSTMDTCVPNVVVAPQLRTKTIAWYSCLGAVSVATNSFPHGPPPSNARRARRSEEHTSELQSPCNLVCRLLLEKKKNTQVHQDRDFYPINTFILIGTIYIVV